MGRLTREAPGRRCLNANNRCSSGGFLYRRSVLIIAWTSPTRTSKRRVPCGRGAWATATSPRPEVEIFTFVNGSGIGVFFYVDPDQVLTPEQHLKAIWLEFEVEDENATAAKLEALGMRSFEYFDRAHKYLQAPGGQVFRLAQH